MNLNDTLPVVHGAGNALDTEEIPVQSEGSDLIIKEALSDDPQPLYCLFLGPLTDMASALMTCPGIGNKLTAIWIGGGEWPAGESWVLGDSAAVGLLPDQHEHSFQPVPAPCVDKDMRYIHNKTNRCIRVYSSIDARFILEDFFARLAICFPKS